MNIWQRNCVNKVAVAVLTVAVVVAVYYVAAKATYIRLLHGEIGFLGGFSALAP